MQDTAAMRKETIMSNTSFTAKNYALIDLHLHLDGLLPLYTVRQLASMQGGVDFRPAGQEIPQCIRRKNAK